MPDYRSYSAVELAQDDLFIRWVHDADAEATRFWEAWLAEHPGQASEVAAARRLVESLRFAEKEPSAERVDRLWSRIEAAADRSAEPKSGPPRAGRRRRLRWLGYVAAACAVALLVLQWWNSRGWEVIETDAGQQFVHQLPDGSVVELNAATTLRYRPERFGRERSVELSGEAFFDVVEGSGFEVRTEEGRVRVLGTTFNVLSRAAAFSVDCFTGRVAVTLRGAEETAELAPAQGVRLEAGTGRLTSYTFEKSERATWRRRMITYEGDPLGEVFDALERQFDVTVIAAPAIEAREAKGFFRTRVLPEAVEDVLRPMGLEFELRGDTVFVTR